MDREPDRHELDAASRSVSHPRGPGRFFAAALLSGLLAACASEAGRAPDTAVLEDIQEVLEEAALDVGAHEPAPPGADVLDEMMPSISIDESLLTPVEERFNIVANREDAQDFFANLVAGTDYGVAVSPRVQGEISLSLPNVTIDEVMQAVEQTYGYQVSQRGNIYHIQPGGLQTRIFSIDYLDVQRQGSSQVQVTSGSSSGLSGSGNNSQFNNGFNSGGYGGNFGGNLGGNFGGGFNNQAGLNNQNFRGGGSGGGGGQVSTQSETDFWSGIQETVTDLIGAGETVVVQENDGGLLSGLTGGGSSNRESPRRKVVVQPQVGLIIVTAYPEELDRVAQYINAAQDVLSREVTIQVQFLEVVLNKGYQSAIDFDTFGPGGAEGSDNNVTGSFSSDGGALDAISNPLSITTNFTDFDAVFRILESRGTTQVLSSPSLKVLNNQKAVFQDGDEEFFQTGVGSSTIAVGENTTTNFDNNIQPFFSGISMDITPQISAGGDITLHVHPTISTVNEQTKSIGDQQVPLARTSVRELDSIIRARNGRIVVLGGLAYERSVDDSAGVPVLNDVPVAGALFDQRSRRTVKSEFIILLRPIIADPQSEQKFIRESSDRFRQLNREIDPFSSNR